MKKNLLLLFTILFSLNQYNATAQILFSEDFGQSTTRITTPYMPAKAGNYIFADPNYPDNPATPGSGYSDENFLSRIIENGYYAVIDPKHIKDAYPSSGYFDIWTPIIDDHTVGDTNGAAIVVNAGLLLSEIYKRDIPLVAGNHYRMSYWVYVQNNTVTHSVKVNSPSGNTTLLNYTTLGMTQGIWNKVEFDFFVPATCISDTYSIAINNKNAANGGNDFMVDDISLTQIPSASAVSPITMLCATAEPKANNDVGTSTTAGSTVNISILTNDILADGATTATTTTTTVSFEKPDQYDANKITVAGEGVWTYTPSTGSISFVPTAGFLSDPTPIKYKITEIATGTSSNWATISVAYGNTPKAFDDTVTGTSGSSVVIPILSNDKLGNGTTTATASTVTVQLIVPFFGGSLTGNVLTVFNEGTWTYDTVTGNLTFAPEAGFTESPTPITYTITESGKKSAPATVTVTVAVPTVKIIKADDDNYSSTPISAGSAIATSVLSNDTLDTTAVVLGSAPGQVSITGVTGDVSKLSLDTTTGIVSVSPGTTSGTYKITYTLCENGASPVNCDTAEVTVVVQNSVAGTNLCYEKTVATNFSTSIDASDSSIYSYNFVAPKADYGFQFDIYTLDNSFNLKINGVNITTKEIQFQAGNATLPQNVRFADGSIYGVGAGTIGKQIYQLTGVSNAPIIRVIINPSGEVSLFGSKINGGELFPLELMDGNTFNTIIWDSVNTNSVVATQYVIGPTHMTGSESGLQIAICKITAVPDPNIPYTIGQTNPLPLVTDNDTFRDVAIDLTDGTVSVTDNTSTEYPTSPIIINTNGSITVPTGTTPGTYPFAYTICEIGATPANCSATTGSVIVSPNPKSRTRLITNPMIYQKVK